MKKLSRSRRPVTSLDLSSITGGMFANTQLCAMENCNPPPPPPPPPMPTMPNLGKLF